MNNHEFNTRQHTRYVAKQGANAGQKAKQKFQNYCTKEMMQTVKEK